MSFEKNWRAANYGSLLRKLTFKAGTNQFFKVWAPMSLVKCLTSLDVKSVWHSELKAIIIEWSHFQSASNKLHKFYLIFRCELLLLAEQRKHQSFTSLAFVREIHQWLVNSQHKGPAMGKMFPFDDVIMMEKIWNWSHQYYSLHEKPLVRSPRLVKIHLD